MLPKHAAIGVQRMALQCDPAHDTDAVHDHAGIAVYLAGRTRLWMTVDYELTRGDVLLMPEGMAHATRGSQGGELWGVMLCSQCMRGSWGEALRQAFAAVRAGGVPVRRLGDAGLGELERVLVALTHELHAGGAAHSLMVDGLMAQLVALLERASRPVQNAALPEGAPTLVAQALAFIDAHCARGISLSDVAKELGRSPTHLAALVKEHTGRTVLDWITGARMARARQLLVASEQSVDVIAAEVGFASPSHFHRTFRKHHGTSPRLWRLAHARAGGVR